jgi:hypothetical protein
MLAVTVSTTPGERTGTGVSRPITSPELDRVERGEEDTVAETEDHEDTAEEREARGNIGYEHVTVRVGVVDTIRELWESEARIVRRFR